MSWLESRAAGGHRFRMAALRGATWAPAITIAEGTDFLANWADFPSVFVTSNGMLAAHWLDRGAGKPYGIRFRTSTDGGRTWSQPATPHRDSATGEYGFVSFFEAPGAGLGLVWLDGREMSPGPGSGQAGHGGHGSSMALRASTIKDELPGEQIAIDTRVCECCQTSAARTSDAVIVAYRDRSEKEIRDISVVRLANGQWSAPSPVHADGWEINGCPVNGPVVTARGNSAAVVWFTMAGGPPLVPQVRVAFSADGGRRFGAPIALHSTVTLGRLGMVMPADDRVIVSSIERGQAGAELVVREAWRDGRTGERVVVSPSTADRSSGFARMAVGGGRIVIAWTDVRPGAPLRIKVASAPLR